MREAVGVGFFETLFGHREPRIGVDNLIIAVCVLAGRNTAQQRHCSRHIFAAEPLDEMICEFFVLAIAAYADGTAAVKRIAPRDHRIADITADEGVLAGKF